MKVRKVRVERKVKVEWKVKVKWKVKVERKLSPGEDNPIAKALRLPDCSPPSRLSTNLTKWNFLIVEKQSRFKWQIIKMAMKMIRNIGIHCRVKIYFIVGHLCLHYFHIWYLFFCWFIFHYCGTSMRMLLPAHIGWNCICSSSIFKGHPHSAIRRVSLLLKNSSILLWSILFQTHLNIVPCIHHLLVPGSDLPGCEVGFPELTHGKDLLLFC